MGTTENVCTYERVQCGIRDDVNGPEEQEDGGREPGSGMVEPGHGEREQKRERFKRMGQL